MVHLSKPGIKVDEAEYIPQKPDDITALMKNWIEFVHNSDRDFLLKVAIAHPHYQFEAIHPFMDGNGRLERLIISFLLSLKGKSKSFLIQ